MFVLQIPPMLAILNQVVSFPLSPSQNDVVVDYKGHHSIFITENVRNSKLSEYAYLIYSCINPPSNILYHDVSDMGRCTIMLTL